MDLDQKHCFLPRKFADLGLADWDTMEISSFAIYGLIITDLRTGTPPKFSDLRLRNEPKNLRICGLTKKFACPRTRTVPAKYR